MHLKKKSKSNQKTHIVEEKDKNDEMCDEGTSRTQFKN